MKLLSKLQAFRQEAYSYLGRAKDAIFELMDAVILTRTANSFADFSLCPVFRRQWSSVYESVQDARPQRNNLMKFYIKQIEQEDDILLAGDHTAWPRPDAVTLKERTYEHHKQPGYGGQPVATGYGYSTLALVPEAEGSWALPLRHERITSWENPIDKAVWQLKQVIPRLPKRATSCWDIEYGCAPFIIKTANIEVDKIIRLRSNLCLWTAPPEYCGRGRRRVHGNKFKFLDESTWGTPASIVETEDEKLGRLKIRLWHELHLRKAHLHPMSVMLVERLNLDGSKRVEKPMWLAFIGESMPDCIKVLHFYLRRFGVDHWYRFAKQRLHWTLPKFSTPEQSDRWSDLMPLITWQLWLARDMVKDNPLPWQKKAPNLTPGRVAQSMGAIFALIGTPAKSPKPRGKSPGWKPQQPRQRRINYPVVKKGTKKRTKQPPKPS
jgi:DDE superfamily endonuclease